MLIRNVALFLSLTAGCAQSVAPRAERPPTTPASANSPGTETVPLSSSAPEDASAHSIPVDGAAHAVDTQPLEGKDFLREALVLFHVAACGDGGPPEQFDPSVVSRHCEALDRDIREYKTSWLDEAEPFLSGLRPKNLPTVVVYPFGGGGLVSALATFPEASEITTISLEPAGDVRAVDSISSERLRQELAVHRDHLERLFAKAHSRTDNLEKESKTELPGEIVFALAALAVHGAEPVSLRYFRLRPDGSQAFVTQEDIDDAAHHPRAKHALFDNVELRFRLRGDAGAGTQVLKHIAFNLDDAHLKADPSLLAYLSSKGKVAAMTKAASHLLWNEHFSLIRGWIVDHTDWMISDSTGIPPRVAQAAGFTQETFGRFDGPAPFGLVDERDADDFKRLFAAEPARNLAFRFGYPDKEGHAHLIVTSRAVARDD